VFEAALKLVFRGKPTEIKVLRKKFRIEDSRDGSIIPPKTGIA
jgi:hypothetical protein